MALHPQTSEATTGRDSQTDSALSSSPSPIRSRPATEATSTGASAAALDLALDELADLADQQDGQAVELLRSRLLDGRLRVLVAGEAKRGKSTLVNALLGRPVLPAGVTPLTAIATTVRYGHDESVTAVFRDRTEQAPLTALDDLVTERGNPANGKGLASVTVWLDAPLLARGIELVDTPGTGSVFEHNTAAAESALETLDAAIFVLSADPPVSASERDLISRVAVLSATMFVVLNKADNLQADELAEAQSFSSDVVAKAAGRSVRLYPVSARAALRSHSDAGFAEFAADFTSYVESGRAADLRYSVAGKARRIATSLRDELALTRQAAQLVAGESEGRVRAFAERLTAVAGRRRYAADLAGAESRRMLAVLNEAAEQAGREGTGRVNAALSELLAGELGSASAAEIETAGRARLMRLAVNEAETWRQQQAALLEDGLAALDVRLTADLSAEFDGVRRAAAQLLRVELTASGPGEERLAPDLQFFYQVSDEAGQTELLAGAIRRRLPGEAGRNRARGYLRREAEMLVPKQFGRARADLQYRLAEATRQLIREIQTRYDDGTRRLERALADASRLRTATEEDLAARDQELAKRQAALEVLITRLDPVAPRT